MEYKNKTIMKCTCEIKSLIGFDVSEDMANTLVGLPVTNNYDGDAIGVMSNIDYKNNIVTLNLWTYALPEINIDENGKALGFKSISFYNKVFETEPTFKVRFEAGE